MDCTYNLTWLKSRPAQGRERFKNGFRLKIWVPRECCSCRKVVLQSKWEYVGQTHVWKWKRGLQGNSSKPAAGCLGSPPSDRVSQLSASDWPSPLLPVWELPRVLSEEGRAVTQICASLVPRAGKQWEREEKVCALHAGCIPPPPLLIIIIFSKYLFLLWSFFSFKNNL